MPIDFLAIPAFAYRLLGDAVQLIHKRAQKPEALVEHRERLREVIMAGLKWNPATGGYGDAIIRDIKRLDHYPDMVEDRGISSWFRTGLAGTYHRGIQVGLGYEGLIYDEGIKKWRLESSIDNPEVITAARIGWIPYDNIVRVNWDGDENYGMPHFFCKFSRKGEPYEAIFYARRGQPPGAPAYYDKLVGYDDVRVATARHAKTKVRK